VRRSPSPFQGARDRWPSQKGATRLFLRFAADWKSIYTDEVRGHGISRIGIASGKVQTFVHGFTRYLSAASLAVGPGPG
jgi:hypothetical protein